MAISSFIRFAGYYQPSELQKYQYWLVFSYIFKCCKTYPVCSCFCLSSWRYRTRKNSSI